MTEYLMVAICHDIRPEEDEDELMSADCFERFETEVKPLITNDSLILLEGICTHGLVHHNHPLYTYATHKLLRGSLGTRQPAFAGIDHRATSDLAVANAYLALITEWQGVVGRLVRVADQMPRDFAELMDIVRTTPPPARLTAPPSPKEIAMAQRIHVDTRVFDRRYMELMSQYANRFDRCFFIGGTSHAVSLGVKTGHPTVFVGPPELIPDVYLSYLAFTTWPESFFRPGP